MGPGRTSQGLGWQVWVLMSLGRRCWSISFGIHIWIKSCWILATYADNDCKYLIWFLIWPLQLFMFRFKPSGIVYVLNFFFFNWLSQTSYYSTTWLMTRTIWVPFLESCYTGKITSSFIFYWLFYRKWWKGKNLHETNIFKIVRKVTIKQTNELNANNCKEVGIRLGWTGFFLPFN